MYNILNITYNKYICIIYIMYILYIYVYIHIMYIYSIYIMTAADLGFNFKRCATSGQAASINGTRGLGGVLGPRSQCIQSYLAA